MMESTASSSVVSRVYGHLNLIRVRMTLQKYPLAYLDEVLANFRGYGRRQWRGGRGPKGQHSGAVLGGG